MAHSMDTNEDHAATAHHAGVPFVAKSSEQQDIPLGFPLGVGSRKGKSRRHKDTKRGSARGKSTSSANTVPKHSNFVFHGVNEGVMSPTPEQMELSDSDSGIDPCADEPRHADVGEGECGESIANATSGNPKCNTELWENGLHMENKINPCLDDEYTWTMHFDVHPSV